MNTARTNDLLCFVPVRKTPIWGTEDWLISAHPHGETPLRLADGSAGPSLRALFERDPALFGLPRQTRFPLLVKIITARDSLSVQVHPDDAYARLHEADPAGKDECWFILEAPEGAELILGQTARSREEAAKMIDDKNFAGLLRRVPVRPGDFISIPAGTVHAITGGITLLEVQQSSDNTYRLYDYDRLQNGAPRPLHIEKSLDVIRYGIQAPPVLHTDTCTDDVQTLLSGSFARISLLRLSGRRTLPPAERFSILCALSEGARACGQPLPARTAVLCPAGLSCPLEGRAELLTVNV